MARKKWWQREKKKAKNDDAINPYLLDDDMPRSCQCPTCKSRGKVPIRTYYSGRSYQYDWGASTTQASFIDQWGAYQASGTWQGYTNQSATLDYRYIEQVVNALSASHNITIAVGKNFAINLDTKTLTYNPQSFLFSTKGALMATILHEIGHLRFTTSPRQLVYGTIGKKYQNQAFEVLNVVEDCRVDDKMQGEYASAPDIYEANKPIVQELQKKYAEKQKERTQSLERRENILNAIDEARDPLEKINIALGVGLLESTPENSGAFIEIIEAERARITELQNETFSLFAYCAELISIAYGLPTTNPEKRIVDMIEKTKHIVPIVRKESCTQNVLDILEREVYPTIEPLMQKDNRYTRMGMVLDGLPRKYADNAIWYGESEPSIEARGVGNAVIPKEWGEGDYASLLSSVQSGINDLLRRLRFIRTEEQKAEYATRLRRGKIDTKRLYTFASQSNRLFKQKTETKDTVGQFAFSILVDISGSMRGERIIHTTRATIMLAEVFSKMDIPYEVLAFDTRLKVIKAIGEDHKKAKVKIGKMVSLTGGGTKLESGLCGVTIANSQKTHKVCIVLSDGDVENTKSLKAKAKELREKKHIKFAPFSIESNDWCAKELNKQLGVENTVRISDVATLPSEFATLIKSLTKRK